MKVTTPREMESDLLELDSAILRFESMFKEENKGSNYYHIVIPGELSRKICDEVERIYFQVGWKDVKCRTSSENGERPGLTGLVLNK